MRKDLNKVVDEYADLVDDHITSFTQDVREAMDKLEAEQKAANNELISRLNKFRTDMLNDLSGKSDHQEG